MASGSSWKRDFASGLIILLPILVTTYVIVYLYSILASASGIVPAIRPELLLSLGVPEDAVTTRTVTIRAGERADLDVTLRREDGSLDVRGEVPGSVVFLDGRRVGTLGGSTVDLRIDGVVPGVAELTVVAPGYATVVRRVDVPAGVVRDVAVRQDRLPER